jgi:hypothetical protein
MGLVGDGRCNKGSSGSIEITGLIKALDVLLI